jgi:prophage regulatory protein
MVNKILRLPMVTDATGLPPSTLYAKITEGTFPPPVKLGLRSAGWPESEINVINAARIAGKSKKELRTLVVKLVANRKSVVNGV